MRNQRRNPRGARRNTRAPSMQQFRALERRMDGAKILPSMNPSTFVARPWNSWTFEQAYGLTSTITTVQVTAGDIVTNIRNALNISAAGQAGLANTINIKVRTAYCWNISSAQTNNPEVRGIFYEINGGNGSIRSEQRDRGTISVPARCGYQYPTSDQREVLSSSDASRLIFQATGDENSTLVLRAHVLWQSSD